MNQVNTRSVVIQRVLKLLIGKPLWDSWRMMDCQIFDFGSKIPHESGDGETVFHGEFSLRISSQWRIVGQNGIIVGAGDRHVPDGDDFADEAFESGQWTRLDALLKTWFENASTQCVRTVTEIVTDELGGIRIYLSDESRLEVIPVSDVGHQWRFLYANEDVERHFIFVDNQIEHDVTTDDINIAVEDELFKAMRKGLIDWDVFDSDPEDEDNSGAGS